MDARAIVFATALSSGCAASEPGELSVAIYGEELVEEGIGADQMVDGWAVTFDRFLVSVGEVSAADGGRAPALEATEYRVFDLAVPSGGAGQLVARAEVPAGTYDRVGYRVAAAPGDDYGLWVEGRAVRGEVTKTFAWGFPTPTRYSGCEGTAVIDGGPARLELTIHADHLFYDDLISAEPNIAFELIAAADDAGDGDGHVTEAELAAVDLRGQERYQVGNFDIDDLWSFIDRQSSTVGHIDGEGHCAEAIRQ